MAEARSPIVRIGAPGDGADDTGRLQAAIDRAAARGAAVQLDRGVYSVRELRLRPGLAGLFGPATLRGLSPEPEAMITSDGPYFRSRAPRDFVLADLEIDCNAGGQNVNNGARRALFLTGIEMARITRLSIRNMPRSAPYGAEAILLMWSCRHVEIRNCRIDLPEPETPVLGILALGHLDGGFHDEQVREDSTDGYVFPLRAGDEAAVRSGDRLLRITTGKFRRDDAGARIQLVGAGPAGRDLFTRIRRYRNTNEVTLADAPSASARGVEGWVQPGRIRYTEEGACKDVIIADNVITGGTYGIGFQRVDGARIVRNRLDRQIRNIAIQSGSREIHAEYNECLNARSTAIHLAYGIRDSVIMRNRVRASDRSRMGGDHAAINQYVDCAGNNIVLNDIDGPFRFGVYAGAGVQRGRIALNQIAGVDAGIAVESDFIAGMRGAELGRLPQASHVTAVRDSEDLEIRGNTISAGRVGLYFSEITNAWSRPYRNRRHEIAENDLIDPRAEAVHIFESTPGMVRDLKLEELNVMGSARYALPRGRAHFSRIRNVEGL